MCAGIGKCRLPPYCVDVGAVGDQSAGLYIRPQLVPADPFVVPALANRSRVQKPSPRAVRWPGSHGRRCATSAGVDQFHPRRLGDLDIRIDPDLPRRAFRDMLPLARKDLALARAAAALRIKTLAA